jgi:hypothetical protein
MRKFCYVVVASVGLLTTELAVWSAVECDCEVCFLEAADGNDKKPVAL